MLPPPLERLQADVDKLRVDVFHAEQFGTQGQKVALRLALIYVEGAVTAIIAHWRAEEIKRLEAEK